MILIADSGSTKTDWALVSEQATTVIPTQGINPVHQSLEEIKHVLTSELLPQLSVADVSAVYFYGSGVRADKEMPMVALLGELFPAAEAVEAHSDLLGAARALCGHQKGIACILGTGANSCFYDGNQIVENVPSLGYVLGDEGSGAVLGRTLLNRLYKSDSYADVKVLFEKEMGLTLDEIINRVYRQPLPNRFLASLTTFIHRHLDHDLVRKMVVDCFVDFFKKNIEHYRHGDDVLTVNFVGSIAWYFAKELDKAACDSGFSVGKVLQSPMEGLLNYYGVK